MPRMPSRVQAFGSRQVSPCALLAVTEGTSCAPTLQGLMEGEIGSSSPRAIRDIQAKAVAIQAEKAVGCKSALVG